MRRDPKPEKATEAKPPAIRKSPSNESARVLDLEKQLAEALRDKTEAQEQRTAISEILRMISSSPNDIQPVFNAIAAAAARLCAVEGVGVYRFDGALIHFAAHHQWTAKHLRAIARVFPQSLEGDSVTARAIRTHSVVHIPDISVDPEYRARPIVEAGFRTVASVPMLRANTSIGAITVTRLEVAPLTDRQIELLKTFAEQAVIAVENVRLFRELQAKNRDLAESLGHQTAASGILSAISSSPTDPQPVFDSIVRSAAHLCNAHWSAVYQYDGVLVHFVANHGANPELIRRNFPRPPDNE